MMIINNQYKRGDFVYLVTDPEQKKRIVTSVRVFEENDLSYDLACGTENSEHYAFEMSKDPDQNLKMGIENSDHAE